VIARTKVLKDRFDLVVSVRAIEIDNAIHVVADSRNVRARSHQRVDELRQAAVFSFGIKVSVQLYAMRSRGVQRPSFLRKGRAWSPLVLCGTGPADLN